MPRRLLYYVLPACLVMGLSSLLPAQERIAPDDFGGFRDFRFHTPVDAYVHHHIVPAGQTGGERLYRVFFGGDEDIFIDVRIAAVLLTETQQGISRIEVRLEGDVGEALLEAFAEEYLVSHAGNRKAPPNPCLLINARASLMDSLNHGKTGPLSFPPLSDHHHPLFSFEGKQTRIVYGEVCTHEISWTQGSQWSAPTDAGDPEGRRSRFHIRVTEHPEIRISNRMYYLEFSSHGEPGGSSR